MSQTSETHSIKLIAEDVALLRNSNPSNHLLIGFDRDGTLVPYANRPEEAFLDPHVHELLCSLAQCARTTVAVVSARSLAMLRGDFDQSKLILAGNYGLEISFPDERRIDNAVALAAQPVLRRVLEQLAPLVKENAILEDHGLSVCVHWHTVDTEARGLVHTTVEEVRKDFPELLLRAQPTSYEFLPDVQWDKGSAMASISSELSYLGNVRQAFVGDSSGDEPAFIFVNEKCGVSVRVGSAGSNTESKYQIADTTTTAELIQQLIRALQ